MSAPKFCFSVLLLFGVAFAAKPVHAVITITGTEIWDGVNNPHLGDGVLLNNGIYSIPDSVVIASGGTIFLRDPFSANISSSITFEFLPGAGGLTFTDTSSTIDVYKGERFGPVPTFTLNMNTNPINVSAAGAGRIVNGIFVDGSMTGGPMSVAINSQSNVTLGIIDVTRDDASGAAVNITSEGSVDIDSLSNGDVNGGGGSVLPINVTGETLVLGDFDTRAFRADGNAPNGDINLRALGQPEDDVGDFNANTAAVNSITLDGTVNTNGPSPINSGGDLNVTAVKVTLAPTFMADISEGASMTVNAGTTGNGFVEADLFINNSSVTPDTVGFTVFHDGVGPDTIIWNTDSSSGWSEVNNWNPMSIPQANNQTAIFGSVLTSPETVDINQPVLVKAIQLDAPQVVFAGTSNITLEANVGNSGIEVLQGNHKFNVQVTLNNTTDASATVGTELNLNGILNLNGNTLNVSGAGQVNINTLATGVGTINNTGVLGTEGLTGISGSITSSGTLDIDIGGQALGLFDAFGVTGTATLSGLIDVDLTGGFSPTPGDLFTILTASSVSDLGLSLSGPSASLFSLIVNADSVVLQANGASLAGDFDLDNDVDGRDFLFWQREFGTTLDATDLANWESNFGTVLPLVGAVASVPEPTSYLLMMVGAYGILAARSRRK